MSSTASSWRAIGPAGWSAKSDALARAPRALPAPPASASLWRLAPWVVYFPASTFYVVESGSPQPADYVMALAVGTVLASGIQLSPRTVPLIVTFGAFVTNVTLVNLFWTVRLEEPAIALNILFYLYNFGVFITFLTLHTRLGTGFLRVTARAVALALAVQFIVALVLPAAADRNTLFFNNPNQLAYFAVLSSTFLLVTQRAIPDDITSSIGFQVVSVGVALYLTVLSASVAGLAAMAIVAGLLVARRPLAGLAISSALLIALGAGRGWVLPHVSTSLTFLQERLDAKVDQGVGGSSKDRGYGRFERYPEHLLFGAGEGATERFGGHVELHSTAGNILFSYGAIGLLLSLALVCVSVRHKPALMLYLAPALVYGLGHNGLRQPLLWLLLALVVSVEQDRAPTPASAPVRRTTKKTPRSTSRPGPLGSPQRERWS